MKNLKTITALFAALSMMFVMSANATTLSFTEIVDDGGPDLSSQLSAEVSAITDGALFTFTNDVGFDSSITSVFFDVGTADIASVDFSAADSSATGVNFKPITNPNLPEGNTISFDADFGGTKDGSNADGVDAAGEYAGFIVLFGASGFDYADLIADILSGSFRTGLHLTSIALEPDDEGGLDGSDGYVNVVPLPAAAWLFGTALFGFFAASRRKKIS